MNQIGFKKEIAKMIKNDDSLKEIQIYVNTKHETVFGYSKRIENMNKIIYKVNYFIKENFPETALKNIKELIK